MADDSDNPDFLPEVQKVFEEDGIDISPFGPEAVAEILAELHEDYAYREQKTGEAQWAGKARPKLKDAYDAAGQSIKNYERAFSKAKAQIEKMKVLVESFERDMSTLEQPTSYDPIRELDRIKIGMWVVGTLMRKRLRRIGGHLRLEPGLPLRPTVAELPEVDVTHRPRGTTGKDGAAKTDPDLAHCIDHLWLLGVTEVAHLQHLIEIVHARHPPLQVYDRLGSVIKKHLDRGIEFSDPEHLRFDEDTAP